MVEASPLMPGLVPEWAIVGSPVICCGAISYSTLPVNIGGVYFLAGPKIEEESM